MKFHIISALQSKYNAILSKLPHLSEQDDNQDRFSVQTEWLAKFWFVQKSGGFDKLSTSGHSSVIVPLTCPWQSLINMHMEENEESNKLSCTIKEVTSALGESFSFELEQISKHPDQNEAAFCRYICIAVDILMQLCYASVQVSASKGLLGAATPAKDANF